MKNRNIKKEKVIKNKQRCFYCVANMSIYTHKELEDSQGVLEIDGRKVKLSEVEFYEVAYPERVEFSCEIKIKRKNYEK